MMYELGLAKKRRTKPSARRASQRQWECANSAYGVCDSTGGGTTGGNTGTPETDVAPTTPMPPPTDLPEGAVSCDPWVLTSTPKFNVIWTRMCYDACGRKKKMVVRDGHRAGTTQNGFGAACPAPEDPEFKDLEALDKVQKQMFQLRQKALSNAHAVSAYTTETGEVLFVTDDGINSAMSLREDARSDRLPSVPPKVKRDFKELLAFRDDFIKLFRQRAKIVARLGIPEADVDPQTADNGYHYYMESTNDTSGTGYVAANQFFWMISNQIDGMILATQAAITDAVSHNPTAVKAAQSAVDTAGWMKSKFLGLKGLDSGLGELMNLQDDNLGNIFSIFGSSKKPKRKTPSQIAKENAAKSKKAAAEAAQSGALNPLLKTALIVAVAGAGLYIVSGYLKKKG